MQETQDLDGPVLVKSSDDALEIAIDALAAVWIASSCACCCVVFACICMVCSRQTACFLRLCRLLGSRYNTTTFALVVVKRVTIACKTADCRSPG